MNIYENLFVKCCVLIYLQYFWTDFTCDLVAFRDLFVIFSAFFCEIVFIF